MLSEKEQEQKERTKAELSILRKEVELLESHRLMYQNNEDSFVHITPKQYYDSANRILNHLAEIEEVYKEELGLEAIEESSVNKKLRECFEQLEQIGNELMWFMKSLDEELFNLDVQLAIDGIVNDIARNQNEQN